MRRAAMIMLAAICAALGLAMRLRSRGLLRATTRKGQNP